eukprot:15311100-Ditylum_brightwellii.AAC.1
MASEGACISQTEKEEKALDELGVSFPGGKRKKLTRMKESGAWLTVVPDWRNDSALSAEEFRDNLRL